MAAVKSPARHAASLAPSCRPTATGVSNARGTASWRCTGGRVGVFVPVMMAAQKPVATTPAITIETAGIVVQEERGVARL
jgi:hypothetical protein